MSSICEKTAGFFLIFLVAVAPWLLGGTTKEGSWLITVLSFASGLSVVIGVYSQIVADKKKGAINVFTGFNRVEKFALSGCFLFLVYVLVSGLNPCAKLNYSFHYDQKHATGVEVEYLSFFPFLPHSYDKGRTLKAFWKYFALVIVFFSARRWFQGGFRLSADGLEKECSLTSNKRMNLYLWVLSGSSGVLAFVGVLQKLDGTDKLLWFYSQESVDARNSFGPFPYQSNAAQYLNLIWPVTFGFWWLLGETSRRSCFSGARFGSNVRVVLAVFISLMIFGVVMTGSKGGFLVFLFLLVFVFGVFIKYAVNKNAGRRRFWGLAGWSSLVIGLAMWLGGGYLLDRFKQLDISLLSGRKRIYSDLGRMVDDFGLFGSGAETFAPLFYFYRKNSWSWEAYAHNDYIEMIITFGWVGMAILLFTFISIWCLPFSRTGITAPPWFVALVAGAIMGLMFHARFDLPFQIYSIQFEFVFISAFLSCLKLETRRVLSSEV